MPSLPTFTPQYTSRAAGDRLRVSLKNTSSMPWPWHSGRSARRSSSGASCLITGWCGLDDHKVFYHESWIDADAAPGFMDKLENHAFSKVWEESFGLTLTIKEMIFKPVNMPELACKELGVAPNTYGILVEKHRATSEKKVVQVDLEYWRLESVELVIRDE